MSYRITYGRKRHNNLRLLWAVPILGILAALAIKDGWYEAFARYVGAAIRGH